MGGFSPIGTMDGSDYHGKLQVVLFKAAEATATFLGDMVTPNLANLEATDSYPAVAQADEATVAASLLGAVHEFFPNFNDEGTLITNFRAASTEREARIIRGTAVIYAVQTDNDDQTAGIDGTNIGETAEMVNNAGDTITGISGQQLDNSSVGAPAVPQFLIQGFDEIQGDVQGTPGIDLGNPPFAFEQLWNVTINDGVGSTLRGG